MSIDRSIHGGIPSSKLLKESNGCCLEVGSISWSILLPLGVKKYRNCDCTRKWIQAETRSISFQNNNIGLTIEEVRKQDGNSQEIQQWLPSKICWLIINFIIIISYHLTFIYYQLNTFVSIGKECRPTILFYVKEYNNYKGWRK